MKPMRALQRGAAAVELGLLLVPMVTLVFGVTEFGRAMYQYNAIAKAARDGARFLTQFEAGDAARATQARCLVVYGNTACGGAVLAPGLTVQKVAVSDASNTPALKFQPVTANGVTVGVTNLVRVTVSDVPFTSLVSFVVPNFVFDPISVTMGQAIP